METLKNVRKISLFIVASVFVFTTESIPRVADNGNETFTNPLFYEEFSDPDMIRVGDDYYLTGTTMHSMPGLPVLHSRDMVNWEFLCYAFDRLDLGPEFRLEGGRDIYGQGIWAPCFREHGGTYYIFTNINGKTTQMFRTKNAAGPWTRTAMKRSFHDLSVLFDDDPATAGKGKGYVIWGYQGINFAQLNDELTDIIPGTQRIIIKKDAGMGEGLHFYKIKGKYYITSACWDGRMRMACARSDKPEGPYEVNQAISIDEDFGLAEGYRLKGLGRTSPPFNVNLPNTRDGGRMSMHQGGIIDTKTGQWWGFSMMEHNCLGRLTCLSPITWEDGWPYFGLPGNLKRSPRTWVKPDTGNVSEPREPYERNDDFSSPKLKPIWQWNHLPDDSKWSLSECPGFLRLHSLPAAELMSARNTLTQRSIGPVSIPTVVMDINGMQAGDVAGLALFNAPYAWIGVSRSAEGASIEQYNQLTGKTESMPFKGTQVWLRANCDFLTEKARFSYSIDGEKFEPLGAEFTMIFQLRTFQGIRYSLFNYNTQGNPGGYADFDKFTVDEVYPNGLMRPIPFDKVITISTYDGNCVLAVKDGNLTAVSAKDPLVKSSSSQFKVVDRGLGRVALQSGNGFVSVMAPGGKGQVTLKTGQPADAETFQWTENVYGDLMLLSLVTHRHIRIDPQDRAISADCPGPKPDRKDGSCLTWETVKPASAQAASADRPVARMDRNSQTAHTQLLEKARKGGIDVYFEGDSITRRWGASDYPNFLANWKQNFFGWNAADFGWGADNIQNILWRLDNGELDNVNPKVIVVLAGTNNVGSSPSKGDDDPRIADVTKGIKAILDICRKKAPQATIVLMGITPRNDGLGNPTGTIPIINKVNENIARFADGKNIRYLNINDKLADKDGTLLDGMTVDKLHLTLKGYQVWADALKPILTELLGPPAGEDHAPPPTGDPSAKTKPPAAS